MTVFIGAEYLIAIGLMRQLKSGKDTIAFAEVISLGEELQAMLNSVGEDAIVIRYNLSDTIAQFGNYFEEMELNCVPYIKCKDGINILTLENRFLGYLPLSVLQVMNAMTFLQKSAY